MNPNLQEPYNIFPAIERLRNEYASLSSDERAQLKLSLALHAPDREAVALLVDIEGEDWAHIYPPVAQPGQITTDQAIDTFIRTYSTTDSSEEEKLLEKLIFNPVPEYSQVLQQEAGHSPKEDPDNLAELAAGINTPEPAPIPEPAPAPQPKPQPNTSRKTAKPPLSLELAKIFIKQQQFERAHDIISKISLNNPEKSIYFADQLRFLEKLIALQQKNKNKSNKPETLN